MLNSADIRFKSDGRQAVHASQVHFPLRLQVQRPTAVAALADARYVVDQLRRAAEATEFPDARLLVLDPDADDGRATTEFVIEQKAKQQVRLCLNLTIALILEGGGAFWAHAAAIAAAADFLQDFATRLHDKGIEVDVQQGRIINKDGALSEAKAGGPA